MHGAYIIVPSTKVLRRIYVAEQSCLIILLLNLEKQTFSLKLAKKIYSKCYKLRLKM